MHEGEQVVAHAGGALSRAENRVGEQARSAEEQRLPPFRVVHEDEDLVVVDKARRPADRTHPGERSQQPAVAAQPSGRRAPAGPPGAPAGSTDQRPAGVRQDRPGSARADRTLPHPRPRTRRTWRWWPACSRPGSPASINRSSAAPPAPGSSWSNGSGTRATLPALHAGDRPHPPDPLALPRPRPPGAGRHRARRAHRLRSAPAGPARDPAGVAPSAHRRAARFRQSLAARPHPLARAAAPARRSQPTRLTSGVDALVGDHPGASGVRRIGSRLGEFASP